MKKFLKAIIKKDVMVKMLVVVSAVALVLTSLAPILIAMLS